jgi:uncharacterized protein (TIGR02246 family)
MRKSEDEPRINTNQHENRSVSWFCSRGFVLFRGYPFLFFRDSHLVSQARIIPFLALILVSSYAVFPQSRAEREVSDTVKQWASSIVSRDMDALGRVLSDDIVITDSSGNVRGKKEELEILKPSPQVKTVSVDNDEVKIRVFGKTAVVTALTKMVFNIGGKESAMSMRYTAVFVKKDGRWQIVALQSARVPGQNRER